MIYNYEYFHGNKLYNSSYQLGAYYDMRYMTYFTRCKFILGLSSYDDDDTVFEREGLIVDIVKNYKGYFVLGEYIRKQKQPKNEDKDPINDPVGQACVQIAEHIQKKDPYDEAVDEFLLHTYPEIDEQELNVCRTIVWTIWNIGTPYYEEVVASIMAHKYERQCKIFANIGEVEATIMGLVHKGILTQEINHIGNPDQKGNIRWRYDEPNIILSFTIDPSEAINAIGEIFGRMITSFIGPRTPSD